MRNKTDLTFSQQLEQYRREFGSKFHDDISQKLETMRSQGKFPFEGKWRSQEEISDLQKLMLKKDRTIFRDLIILFFIIFLINLIISAALIMM
jgi:hypothetical protein